MRSGTRPDALRAIAWKIVASLVCLFSLAAATGCLTKGGAVLRSEEYRPRVTDRSPWLWEKDEEPADIDVAEPAAPDMPAASDLDTDPSRRSGSRVIRRGDTLVVGLRGIPKREDVREVVDEKGSITMPLLGTMKLDGMTTGEAETAIQKAYIQGGYYRSLDIIVVAERDVYYVRGEVTRQGRYALTSEITLLQAIAAAGGYTDYARSTVKVIRGKSSLTFNVRRIEKRKEKDPLIEPGDIIVIQKRIFW